MTGLHVVEVAVLLLDGGQTDVGGSSHLAHPLPMSVGSRGQGVAHGIGHVTEDVVVGGGDGLAGAGLGHGLSFERDIAPGAGHGHCRPRLVGQFGGSMDGSGDVVGRGSSLWWRGEQGE